MKPLALLALFALPLSAQDTTAVKLHVAEQQRLADSASVYTTRVTQRGDSILAALRKPQGVAVFPGQSIQAAVDANPAGTTFLLKAGMHLRQSVVPKANDVFRGEVGTIMDGQNATAYAFTAWNGSAWIGPSPCATSRSRTTTRPRSAGRSP